MFAGVRKIISPVEFAAAISGLKMMPEFAVNSIALGLPLVEVALGTMLIAPRASLIRIGALGLIVMNFVFVLSLSQAWARGLTVKCGCFGFDGFPPSKWTLPVAIIRDLFFVGVAVYLYAARDTVRERSGIKKRPQIG